jgi:hypothetical protein
MSIFSRLLKRNPEDGGGPAADPPAPATPAAGPRPTPTGSAEAKPASKPDAKPAAKPEAKAEAQPEPKREAKPETKADAKPEAKPDSKADAKPEAKPDSKPEPPPSAGKTMPYAAVPRTVSSPGSLPGMVPAPPTPRPPVVRDPNEITGATAPRDPKEITSARAAKDPKEITNTGAPRDPKEITGTGGPPRPPRLPPRKADGAPPAPGEPILSAGSVEQAIEKALFARVPAGASGNGAGEGTSTASDRAAVLATFEDLAVVHTAQVRSFMLEVRWGEPQTSWIELVRPALRSLRAMGNQLGNTALTVGLDGFDAALEKAVAPGAPPLLAKPTCEALLGAYAPLVTCMARAFELEGERDRREPLVVRALLGQVQGLDPMHIEKMTAVGLGRLDSLLHARADEIAVVAGVPEDVAVAAVARVQAFRKSTPSALTTLDPAATARELAAQVRELEAEHRAFEDAARGWSDGNQAAKKQLRRQRDVSFLQAIIALARLGEIDLALRLEKLPFARRIDELERFVSRSAPSTIVPATRMDGGHQPGAPAAP